MPHTSLQPATQSLSNLGWSPETMSPLVLIFSPVVSGFWPLLGWFQHQAKLLF